MAAQDITTSVLDDPYLTDFQLYERQSQYADVARPTLAQCQVRDITAATFESYAVSNDGTIRIPITVSVIDVPTAKIQLSVSKSLSKRLKDVGARYYLSMTKGGTTKRLWTGAFTVKSEAEA